MNSNRISQPLFFLAIMLTTAGLVASSNASAGVIHVPSDFETIQAAVDAAQPGDIIQVSRGVYSEHVTVETSNIRLKGHGAVIDGADSGGVGLGIHVLGAIEDPVSNVEIMGFIVQNFERGIVLENVENSRVHGNEVRNNTDKDPEDGCFNMADGIVLDNTRFSVVSQNNVNGNGHNGIFLIRDSSGNTVRANKSNGNGAQTIDPCGIVAGCGIQLSNGDNNDNDIIANETHRNAWGILLGPSGGPMGNFIGQNRSHENPRAGIALRGDADDNVVQQNNATGNGLLDLSPSFEFDLFDGSTGENTWLRNKGTANF